MFLLRLDLRYLRSLWNTNGSHMNRHVQTNMRMKRKTNEYGHPGRQMQAHKCADVRTHPNMHVCALFFSDVRT